MRILWVACSQPGSLYPAVPIVLELVRRGHAVTALCDGASQPTFESLGVPFRPRRELDRHLAGFDAAAHGGGRSAKLAWHARYVEALYADAHRELADGAYDTLMFDPLEPGADFAAEAAGVPSFSYVHWRMSETGPDVPFRFHLWAGDRPADESFVDWWNAQRALVGLGPETRPVDEARWYRHSRALTLILGLPELAHPKGAIPSYARRIGPTTWLPPAGEAPPWLDELGRDRPAILASVSTVGAVDSELLEAVGDAMCDEPVDVVATVPSGAALPRLPSNVRVAPFVPHSLLLPRVSTVVSHAGNGTVTAAACSGVPLLLLPAGRDQFEVASGAAAAGVAIVLERADLSAVRMRSAVRALLGPGDYRTRAAEIARRARSYDARAAGATAVEELLGAA